VQARLRAEGDVDDRSHLARIVLDFLAGSTDRHIVVLHEQIFSPTSRLLPHID
jgi:dGTP triphosphohydrolase